MEKVEKAFLADGRLHKAVSVERLRVAQGEFVALIGPSGCGKTTLLRLAGGLIPPDTGSILIDGATPVPGVHTATVFQNFRLLPWATAKENVEFALRSKNLSRRERSDRADTYLELVGLTRSAAKYPRMLSGGMRQRVALARALACEAELLLMDEPFASLDAQTRELMQLELLQIWGSRGMAVLFVTHSVDEALLLADNILLLGEGEVLERLDVNMERPRSRGVRTDRQFLEMRTHLWSRIRELVTSDPRSEFFGRSLNE